MVVADGETLMLPAVGCDPIPLSMFTEVASEVDHVSVEDCPDEIVVGLALKLMDGAGVVPKTVTVSEAFAGTLPLLSQNWTTMECVPVAAFTDVST